MGNDEIWPAIIPLDPLSDRHQICHAWLRHGYLSPRKNGPKVKVSRFTRIRSYEWRCKMLKTGWFEMVRGHSRSWAMPSFDRAHMTSYSTLIETICDYLLPFSKYSPVVCWKSPILTHPTCISCPRRWWLRRPRSNFAEIFGFIKLESLCYRVVLFVWSYI